HSGESIQVVQKGSQGSVAAGGDITGGVTVINNGESGQERERRELNDKQSSVSKAVENALTQAKQIDLEDEMRKTWTDAQSLIEQNKLADARVALDNLATHVTQINALAKLKAELADERSHSVDNDAPDKSPDLWNAASAAEADGFTKLKAGEADSTFSIWKS